MEGTDERIVCQCAKCNHLYDYEEVDITGIDQWLCPECKGKCRVIKFKNRNDEIYLNKLSVQEHEY